MPVSTKGGRRRWGRNPSKLKKGAKKVWVLGLSVGKELHSSRGSPPILARDEGGEGVSSILYENLRSRWQKNDLLSLSR